MTIRTFWLSADLGIKSIIGSNNEGEICYLYPLSIPGTRHRARLADGREFRTICAVDSLGCAATFGMPVEAFSFCRDTDTSLCQNQPRAAGDDQPLTKFICKLL